MATEPRRGAGSHAHPGAASPPVLVLGSGITPLGVIRCLGRSGIRPFCVDAVDPWVPRSRWYEGLPRPGGEKDLSSEAFAGWLEGLPLEQAVLMPCSDSWTVRVASLEAGIRERFRASLSAPSTLGHYVDKGPFADLLCRTGTPHPWSHVLEAPTDLDSLPDAVFSSAILKPRDSQRFFKRYGVKAFHVRSREDAKGQLVELLSAGFPVILQEYVPGPARNHYFVDGFIDRSGTVRAVFVRQRLRMFPPDFGNSTYMVSVTPDAAAPAVRSITSLLTADAYRGIFSAEFKQDARDGTFKLLEVNARPWWYVEFAARCGVDVCRMAYEDALERPVASVTDYAVGRRLVYPYYDLPACVALRRRGELSVWGWTRSWAGAAQPVFMWRDAWPAVRDSWTVGRGFVGGRLRAFGGALRAGAGRLLARGRR